MEQHFQHGDIVVRRNKRDERGTVRGSAQRLAGRNYYRVLFPSSPNPVQVGEADLEAVTLDMTIEERLLNGEYGNKNTFSRLLTFERLRYPLQDTLYSLRASRTEFQAGFILCEMLARYLHNFRRALVVCKASLCIKWQMEMQKRFDLRFDIFKAEQLKDFLRRYREDEDLELRAICSLESFRSSTVMQEWEAMPPPGADAKEDDITITLCRRHSMCSSSMKRIT